MGNMGTKISTTWSMISQRLETQALGIASPFTHAASSVTSHKIEAKWEIQVQEIPQCSWTSTSTALNQGSIILTSEDRLRSKWGDICNVPHSTRHLMNICFPSALKRLYLQGSEGIPSSAKWCYDLRSSISQNFASFKGEKAQCKQT